MKIAAWIFVILLALFAPANFVRAQVLESNLPAQAQTPTNQPSASDIELIPLIQMQDVPITAAIENLARQADINYMIDPYRGKALTGSAAEGIPEPRVNFRLQNVSAKDALTRLLDVRNFALIVDPVTHIARITRPDQATNAIDTTLLHMEINRSPYSTNGMIPLIQFQDAPLDVALENIIRETDLKIVLDRRLSDYSHPSHQTQILNFRWTNITAKQALVALCLNYDLVIVRDGSTGNIRIEPKAARK